MGIIIIIIVLFFVFYCNNVFVLMSLTTLVTPHEAIKDQ